MVEVRGDLLMMLEVAQKMVEMTNVKLVLPPCSFKLKCM